MAGNFGKRVGRTDTGAGTAAVLARWIDTTPVESTDEPCRVACLDVHAHVCGLYAEVVETIEIENPNWRDISAELVVPLPDRAAVCGYALEIDGQMVDGVVVPKERARVVFETEQRKGVDPGLVEAVRGNVYRTRVYPVPRRGRRTVRLSYVAPLVIDAEGKATLDLPMPAERLARRRVRVDVEMLDAPAPVVSGLGEATMRELRGCWSVESEERDLVPQGSVRMEMPSLPPTLVMLERDEEGTVWFSASEEVAAS